MTVKDIVDFVLEAMDFPKKVEELEPILEEVVQESHETKPEEPTV
jgi:hypothetical protein